MTVSIIIPTYNGAHKLPFILKAIEKQNYAAEEVLVVIDGSTDDSEVVVERFRAAIPALRIVKQKNSGRAGVRNRGAQEAKGDLLIYFDDDMEPAPDCVTQHVQHHHKFPGSIMTGAQIDVQGSTEMQQFRSALSYHWSVPLKATALKPLRKQQVFITAANFSVSREVFTRLNGFDTSLSDAEDFDLAVRSFKEGVPLFYNHNAFAWHRDIVSCAVYIKRQRQYARAQQVLAEQKPWMMKEGFLNNYEVPDWKKSLFRLFVAPLWISAVDREWFKSLPKALRYKLYKIIITANGVYFPEKIRLS